MTLDVTYLFFVIVFSAVGLAYFIYGKKQAAFVPLLCGLALMVYPYFVSGTWTLIGIGIVVAAIPYFARF